MVSKLGILIEKNWQILNISVYNIIVHVYAVIEKSWWAVFELTSVKRIVFLSSTPDKNSWLSGRLAAAFSVLWGLSRNK